MPDAVIDQVLLEQTAAASMNDHMALKRDLPGVVQLAVVDVFVLLLWEEHDVGPAQFTKDLSVGVHCSDCASQIQHCHDPNASGPVCPIALP